MTAPIVPQAKQGAEARDWSWVEGGIWTERMVSALENGVKGGNYAYFANAGLFTLDTAWRCARNPR